jgi:hypothetical protein
MRRSTCCLLVLLFGSWLSGSGQSAPRLTSPKIVATFERLGLTNGMKTVRIYTPPQWGTFRVSVVMVSTAPAGSNGEFWYGYLQYVNAAGPNQYSVALQSTVLGSAFGDFPIRAKAGTPIKFSVQPAGDNSGSKYNVWIVVEQLM